MSQEATTKTSGHRGDTLPQYIQLQGIDGVVSHIRGEVVRKNILLSTILGIILEFSILLVNSKLMILGVVLVIYLGYYYLLNRKGSLKVLGDGSLSYYTEDLDKQVVRIKPYSRVNVRQELFSLGVMNIILVELLGHGCTLVTGNKYTWVYVLVLWGMYGLLLTVLLKRYGKVIEEELTEIIKHSNKGITIPLTEDEKDGLQKIKVSVADESHMVNADNKEPKLEDSKEDGTYTNELEQDTTPERTYGKYETPDNQEKVVKEFSYATSTVTTEDRVTEHETENSEKLPEERVELAEGNEEELTPDKEVEAVPVGESLMVNVDQEESIVEESIVEVEESIVEVEVEGTNVEEVEEADIFEDIQVISDVETTRKTNKI